MDQETTDTDNTVTENTDTDNIVTDNTDTDNSDRKRSIKNYDFRHPRVVFGKEYMRIVSENSRELARYLGQYFGNISKITVDASTGTIHEYTSVEFLETLNDTVIVSQNKFDESEGALFIMLPTEFCQKYIYRESGGSGDIESGKTTLTAIESKILSRLSRGVVNQIRKVWEPIISLNLNKSIFEREIELLSIKKNDRLVVVEFELIFGEEKELVQIGYTSTLLREVVADNLSQSQPLMANKMTQDDKEAFKRTIKTVPLTLKVLLGQVNLDFDDLNQIKVGDVLPLRQKISQPLNVLAENKIKFKAYPGQSDGHKSIKITDAIEE